MLNKHGDKRSMPPKKDIQKERSETACPTPWSKADTESSTDCLVTCTTLWKLCIYWGYNFFTNACLQTKVHCFCCYISWLLHYSQWISSAVSSLPVTPGIHPNSNTPNQSWAWRLSLQLQNTTLTHFTMISKVCFPPGNVQLQEISLYFSNRCFILQFLYQKKVEFSFFFILLCKKIGQVQKLSAEKEEGEGSAHRACSFCLLS